MRTKPDFSTPSPHIFHVYYSDIYNFCFCSLSIHDSTIFGINVPKSTEIYYYSFYIPVYYNVQLDNHVQRKYTLMISLLYMYELHLF